MQTTNNRKKYWQSLEEKKGQVSSDWDRTEVDTPSVKSSQNQEKRHGLNRRDFLKFMGAGAVMAGASCRRPVEQIVPAVIQPSEYVPGVPVEFASTSPDGSGLLVKTREGRPVFIGGNPDHPLTQGGLTSSTSASLMDLYDPDRARTSYKFDRKTGKKKKMSAEFLSAVAKSELEKGDYVLLTGPISSPSTRALIQDFIKTIPGGKHIELRPDPTLRQISDGQKRCYGQSLIPNYRYDRAELVVAIDSDFMGTQAFSSYFTRQYSNKRNVNKKSGSMNRLVVFESMFTLTGSNADRRYAIRPGDQATIALAIASFIEKELKRSGGNPLLNSYYPSNISQALGHKDGLYKIGVFEAVIKNIATDLWNHRGKSLVVGGSPLAATGKNAEAQIAINYLNSLLNNDGATVDYSNAMQLSSGISDREMTALLANLKGKRLVIAGANPVYHMPDSKKVINAIKKIKYILSLNDRIDETTRHADVLLPGNHYLESWGDHETIKGIHSIQQPVIRPLFETKSFEDRLIQIAGGKLGGASSFYEYIKARWMKLGGGNGRRFWVSALQQGYYAPAFKNLKQIKGPRAFKNNSLNQIVKFGASSEKKLERQEFKLGMYYNVQVLDGSLANNAYRQELPEPVTKIVWDNYVVISPSSATDLGMAQGDIVKLSSGKKSIELPVHIQPGIHSGAALVALGYGRNSAGLVANDVGVNVLELAHDESDSLKLSGLVVKLAATGKHKSLASTQSIFRDGMNDVESAFGAFKDIPGTPLRGSSQYDRPIIREAEYSVFKTGKFEIKPAAIEYVKNIALDGGWNFKDTRWHMTIDLSQCTGCSSCVTACNIENNIPMVGQDQVRRGHEMHWMRIDRYFSGSEENPEVAHQPMLCQQCENAPCENVCPVAATTHNSEGLNVMTYNRCIGTRYCANNCPYKVRRFNWHENWIFSEGLEMNLRSPQQLAMNPDVTTRARGVMEKCTFCIQRISRARQDSRMKGEKYVKDGVFTTACQDVCPSDAIVFGNRKNPDSMVAKSIKDKRSYQVLDFLDVRPSITYLAKIRNKGKGES